MTKLATGAGKNGRATTTRRMRANGPSRGTKLARLAGELKEARQQQTATAAVLELISNSPSDVQPIFDAITREVVVLSNALFGAVFQFDGERIHLVSHYNFTPQVLELLSSMYPMHPSRQQATGRVILGGGMVHMHDVVSDTEYRREVADRGGWRSVLAVPMLRDGVAVGVIWVARAVAGPFPDNQIELLQTFAVQAMIALENTRLLGELRQRGKELAASLNDLHAAQDRLIQTEKLASLGQLTAGIAHEIKNPLNFVNNFSALSAELTDELNDVLKPVAFGEKVRGEVDQLTGMLKSNLEKVVQHGMRADSIVKSMLLHSREGSGEHRSADVNALLNESLNLAYHGARAEKHEFDVTLQRDFDDLAGAIEVFPQEITRALLNLIANGFYAVTKRRVESGPAFEPILLATTKHRGDRVEIRIRDNGTGIPADVKDNMFNPFFTTKPAGEGTGLGLSMTHDIIVKQHGGTIDVATMPGQFSEFTIVLPRTGSLASGNKGQA